LPGGQRELSLRLLKRSPGQFAGGQQRGELRVGDGDAGREPGILDQICLLADRDFAGRVPRPLTTAMYTGRRPDQNA
jgi:hypothetical protein